MKYFMQSLGDVNWWKQDLMQSGEATLLFSRDKKREDCFLVRLFARKEIGGKRTVVQAYQMDVPAPSTGEDSEWFNWQSVASFVGMSEEEWRAACASQDVLARAHILQTLCEYYGSNEFDSYPNEMTKGEARKKFGRWA